MFTLFKVGFFSFSQTAFWWSFYSYCTETTHLLLRKLLLIFFYFVFWAHSSGVHWPCFNAKCRDVTVREPFNFFLRPTRSGWSRGVKLNWFGPITCNFSFIPAHLCWMSLWLSLNIHNFGELSLLRECFFHGFIILLRFCVSVGLGFYFLYGLSIGLSSNRAIHHRVVLVGTVFLAENISLCWCNHPTQSLWPKWFSCWHVLYWWHVGRLSSFMFLILLA